MHIEKDGRVVNRAPAPQIPERKPLQQQQQQQIGQILEPTPDQLDSIKKFQVSTGKMNYLFTFMYAMAKKINLICALHALVLHCVH